MASEGGNGEGIGSSVDTAAVSGGNGSVIALLKGILLRLAGTALTKIWDGTDTAGVDATSLGLQVSLAPSAGGTLGWAFSYQSALNATKVQIKGAAGSFGGWAWLYNPNTAVTFIQVFNKASANVTVGSTTPDFVIALPGVASANATGVAANWETTVGIAMSTGITVAATTTATGSTNPANALSCTFLYL